MSLPYGTRQDLFHAQRQMKGAAKSLQNAKSGLDGLKAAKVTKLQRELAGMLKAIAMLKVPSKQTDAFARLVLDPPKPNPALRSAMRKFKARAA